jgi:hypothetical protein
VHRGLARSVLGEWSPFYEFRNMQSDAEQTAFRGYAYYSIVSAGDGWVVQLNKRDLGPPLPMEKAVETAVRAASKSYQPGAYAHVVLDDGKRLRTLWLNGRLTDDAADRTS